jgi:hypothetical protein
MQTLALNILDIVQNSIRAGASRISVYVGESESDDIMEILISDNGSGIPEAIIEKVTDPFVTTRTTRKTGMGLPLLKYHAEITGGSLSLDSIAGTGTVVKAVFTLSHVDRQPLGDIAGVMTILMSANPGIDFLYSHKTDMGLYDFSSAETKEFLEIDDFSESTLLGDIKELLNSNLIEIGVSDFR